MSAANTSSTLSEHWEILTSLPEVEPDIERGYHLTAVGRHKIALVGITRCNTTTMWVNVWDSRTRLWQSFNMIGPKRSNLTSAAIGDCLYVFGGLYHYAQARSHNPPVFERVSPSCQVIDLGDEKPKFRLLANMTWSRHSAHAVTLDNRFIVLLGGYGMSNVPDEKHFEQLLEEYNRNIESDEVSPGTDFKLQTVETLDVVSNTWTHLPPMPLHAGPNDVAVAVMEKLVLVLGTSKEQRFDWVTQKWQTSSSGLPVTPHLPEIHDETCRRWWTSGMLYGSQKVICCIPDRNRLESIVFLLDPMTHTWSLKTTWNDYGLAEWSGLVFSDEQLVACSVEPLLSLAVWSGRSA